MSFARLGFVALAVYFVVLLIVAELARRARKDRTPADHVLAGRQLGMWVLFLTLYATAYSGNSLLGYPGEAYRRGFSWVMATGFMMAIVVVFHALVPRLRPIAITHGFVTPGDWVRLRFSGERWGAPLRIAVALLMTVALANFLLAQLTAMGIVAHQITGGLLPYWVGVMGLAGVILFYETLGGMRAVAWTDTAQALLMMVGLGALLTWLMDASGGLAEVTRRIGELRPAALAVPDAEEQANWVSTLLLLGFASIVYPQAIQRIYAARSGKDLQRSLALMTFMPLVTTLVVTWIGLAAIPRLQHLGTVEADSVMPRILAAWAETGFEASLLAILVFLGALAAIMSTADSVLLSLGSVVAEDLADRARDAPETTRFGKRVAIAVMVGAVVVALLPRLTLWRLIELKMELLIQCVPVFLLALHWPRLRAGPALGGLLVGTILAAAASLSGNARVAGIHVGVVGLAMNALVCVAGSLRRR